MRKSVIAAAVGFHLILTIAVYLVGRIGLFPQFINTDGFIVADSQHYQSQIVLCRTVLTNSGLAPWFFALLPLHVKLFSLSFILFGWLFGATILAIEPVNAALFLAVLYMVLKVNEEVFGRGTSLLALVIVGLCPSFLLYTTQPLRDPLFIATTLLFLLINIRWLTKDYSLRRALGVVAFGSAVDCLLWLLRSDMWELMIGFSGITALFFIIRLFRERNLIRGNIAGVLLLLVIAALIPRVAVRFYKPAYVWAKSYNVAFMDYSDAQLSGEQAISPTSSSETEHIRSYLPRRIAAFRERFITQYAGAASNIDTEIRFKKTSDVIGYLPRAMMIGLFAPFPPMWFGVGAETGRVGRLVAGLETITLYIIELIALVALWHKRRQLAAWFLLSISITGATALGLVVTNAGTLFRLRYVFVILLVILGSEGLKRTFRCTSLLKR